MNKKILLITGWGGGTKLLQPLQQALAVHHHVDVWNIFNALDHQVLAEKAEKALSYDVIVGWSLGGQLATLLVDYIQQHFQQMKVLVTLASNPCFVVQENWPIAMDQTTFYSFKQSFKNDAVATLKKFGYMVCQGTITTKQDFVKLQSLIQAQSLDTLNHGLNCLENLNNVDILKNYTGYQYHIFSKQDYLVSYKVSQNIQELPAKFLSVELISGSHGFPVFDFEVISCKICQYLLKIN